jgi:plasmid stabilization system protein ParE
LPVRITATAQAQYLGTVRRYLTSTARRPARPQAARRLIDAYQSAIEAIADGPVVFFPHPRPYPELGRYGFRWIKVHRYWFGYLPGAEPIITNILDEVADIPTHVSTDLDPIDTA